MDLPLVESDEPNRFYIQLYHRTATQVDLNGARVLEVSCGHGGGASYLVRTLCPASYPGLDRNTEGVAFWRERHNLLGLDFVQGDAENLPFVDQSLDAVINVEASHCYPRFASFLAEGAGAAPGRAFSVRGCAPPPPYCQVGIGDRRSADAATFWQDCQCGGSARDREKSSLVTEPVRSVSVGVRAPVRPGIHSWAGFRALSRSATRRTVVPDVLVTKS